MRVAVSEMKAIAEELAAMVPSRAEIRHEGSEALETEWAEIAAKEEPCGACGGFCYYWEIKGEPCSMFVTVRGPDGILRGPSDWEFPA